MNKSIPPKALDRPAVVLVIEDEQLLCLTDQAMYQSKLAGKNRYCVFDVPPSRSNGVVS